MTDPKNPPEPLLPYSVPIKFKPQVPVIQKDEVGPIDAGMPFYYASFVGIWVYWLTDLSNVEPHFHRGAFKPYVFTDEHNCEKALVVINFQTYTSHAGTALGTVNEVEFNICCFPTVDAGRIPKDLSVNDFLMGVDQTKRVGLLRIHVPADNTIAIAAGRGFFGEPKFFAQFDYEIPCLNLPGRKKWRVAVYDQDAVLGGDEAPDDKHLIFKLKVPEIDAYPEWANTSPLALYTYVDGKPNGSHWQMLLPMESYCPLPKKVRKKVKIKAGKSSAGIMPDDGVDTSMAADVANLIGDAEPVGIQVFRSQPSCIEGGPFEIT